MQVLLRKEAKCAVAWMSQRQRLTHNQKQGSSVAHVLPFPFDINWIPMAALRQIGK